jgi:hypothetical protein
MWHMWYMPPRMSQNVCAPCACTALCAALNHQHAYTQGSNSRTALHHACAAQQRLQVWCRLTTTQPRATNHSSTEHSTCHHHQITRSSHSINAIGPAPPALNTPHVCLHTAVPHSNDPASPHNTVHAAPHVSVCARTGCTALCAALPHQHAYKQPVPIPKQLCTTHAQPNSACRCGAGSQPFNPRPHTWLACYNKAA